MRPTPVLPADLFAAECLVAYSDYSGVVRESVYTAPKDAVNFAASLYEQELRPLREPTITFGSAAHRRAMFAAAAEQLTVERMEQ